MKCNELAHKIIRFLTDCASEYKHRPHRWRPAEIAKVVGGHATHIGRHEVLNVVLPELRARGIDAHYVRNVKPYFEIR